MEKNSDKLLKIQEEDFKKLSPFDIESKIESNLKFQSKDISGGACITSDLIIKPNETFELNSEFSSNLSDGTSYSFKSNTTGIWTYDENKHEINFSYDYADYTYGEYGPYSENLEHNDRMLGKTWSSPNFCWKSGTLLGECLKRRNLVVYNKI